MAAERSYIKLPGSGYERGSRIKVAGRPTRSYLGPDHLLVVDYPAPGQESYRRVPYRDVESLTIARRSGFGVRITIVTLVVLLSAIGTFQANLFVTVMSWVLVVPFGIILILELIKGPLSRTLIRTRVQEVELASCGRWRSGNQALALIEERILSAQQDPASAVPLGGGDPSEDL